jgi:pyruvate/2-oxoglutarate dehydrogenase complex dihydrolipoamide acyltransferase (E2) component
LKKAMLLAALLAMMLAAGAPAFAQTAAGGDVAILQYSCNQIQAAVATQYQQGEGTGAVAGAAQSLGIDQQQVLACFGTAAAAQDVSIDVKAPKAAPKAKATATATAAPAAPAAAATAAPAAPAAAPAALPPTGGVSLIALGAGVLLVVSGLLARRIIR